jgi:retron-type reverse transcriptase
VATSLAVLMTESIRQPVELEGRRVFVPIGRRHAVQGAPTSPAISNAIALKMDRRLAGLARKIGFTYTRYADDLAFSGDDPAKVARLLRHATAIIESEGFAVNVEKTRVLRRGRRQRVAGVTVAEGVGLSKKERRKIRALIHQQGKDPHRRAQIEGKLAYLHMLNPAQAAALRRRFS